MIQLFPQPSSSDGTTPDVGDATTAVAAEKRPGRPDRPWVYTNMIASADGATATDGRSGGLGSDGDLAMLQALRLQADAIMVGAETARAEKYGPPPAYPDSDQRSQPRPRLVLLTNSLDLDPELPLFDNDGDSPQPLIITSEESLSDGRSDLSDLATVVAAGSNRVDMQAAVDAVGRLGHGRILLEGGPSINGQMIAAGLIDEWNLTVAPLLISGESKRAAVGPLPEGPPPGLTLARVWLEDEYLFCRWVGSRR